MIDQEKVIKGLECCTKKLCIYKATEKECPYWELSGAYEDAFEDCTTEMAKDALALLKAQEPRDFHDGFIGLSEQAFSNPQPVKPNVIMHGKMVMYYQCPACLRTIDSGDRFCRHCGRKVKWDE